MRKIRVKFCGITNGTDAANAVKAGADALGFVFYEESPRYIEPKKAASIIKKLPPFIYTVGVFVNKEPGIVEELTRLCSLNAVQLHGDEDIKYCQGFAALRIPNVKLIKAVRVKSEESVKAIEGCPADAFLLDAYKDDTYGGTGKAFDKRLALIAKEYEKPIILSGGLNPDNVYDIIKEIEPYGVDVSSGIEHEPGKKNTELMEEFTKQVRGAEENI